MAEAITKIQNTTECLLFQKLNCKFKKKNRKEEAKSFGNQFFFYQEVGQQSNSCVVWWK